MGQVATAPNTRIRTRLAILSDTSLLLPAAIQALSPVGYWRLDESAGTTATDYSGNGRDGTYTGSGYVLQGIAGGDGISYCDFGNAASSHVAVADNNVFSLAATLTFFALLKPDTISSTQRREWMGKGSSGNYEWSLSVNDGVNGRLDSLIWTSAGAALARTQADVATASWQAICVVLNTGGTCKTYRNNNTNVGSYTTFGGAYTNGTTPVWIGWIGDSSANRYWQGGIAHPAIFTGELNTTQIQTLMSAADSDGWF